MNHATAVLFVLSLLAGCSSTTLSPAQRLADVTACEQAAIAAGIPIFQALGDKGSTDPQKAQAAQDAIAKTNALPDCLKVGGNAAQVIQENAAARKAK